MVRPYQTSDCQSVVSIHNAVFVDDRHSLSSFEEFVSGTREFGGNAWVIEAGSLAGYAAVRPVPGLPGLAELDGCIAPSRQREGLGSKLWAGVCDNLKGGKITQVAYGVENSDSITARFLRKQNFFVEHEEWILAAETWEQLQKVHHSKDAQLRTFPRQTAVSLFCELYQKSFTGLPWDQPYSIEEVSETLRTSSDLLFLFVDGVAAGFAWVKLDQDIGVIEPIGILPAYQNQGFGRELLAMAMQSLRFRGANRIEIGTWRDNNQAIHLYQTMGFTHFKTITFLAYNID